jgi:hypothetical protein
MLRHGFQRQANSAGSPLLSIYQPFNKTDQPDYRKQNRPVEATTFSCANQGDYVEIKANYC